MNDFIASAIRVGLPSPVTIPNRACAHRDFGDPKDDTRSYGG